MFAYCTRLLSLFLLAGVATSASVLAQASESGYPPTAELSEIRLKIDQVSPQHPRLLIDRQGFENLRQSESASPLKLAIQEAIVKQATAMWELPPVVRELEGRRLLGQSRLCVKRVVTLALAYHLTGERKHLERAEKEMLAAAAFEDWNPSHFLDVAEMTMALAIGYDWLFNDLPDSSRSVIRQAIVAKGVSLPFTTDHNRWVQSTNNWGQVCHGGLTAGALAILEDEPDLAARTVHSAIHNVIYSMEPFAPAGSYPEGPGYWAYGTSYNVLLIAVLESVLGSDFGLTKAPGFSLTGQYLGVVTGPSGLFFNYADGSANRALQPTLFWFAERFDRPDWLLGELELWQPTPNQLDQRYATSSGNRLAPLALLWMDAEQTEPESIRMPLHWTSGGETPISVHRSSWTDPDATFIGLKAGSPSANHGQMDTGSFVLDACGVRWAVDLGAEGYHGIEARGMNLWNRSQDSDRWTIFRQSNEGHNTLVINDQPQIVAGRGEITDFSADPQAPFSIVDMTRVYEGQAESVRRGVAMIEGRNVLIQDEIAGLQPGDRVRWGMITPARVETSDESTIELRQDGKRLRLKILAPGDTRWQIIDTEQPRQEWDSPNPGTRMVAFETSAPENGSLSFAVLVIPCSTEASISEVKVRKLDDWSQRSR
ncbi:MAG: heparinase II/III family protein [Acidobacteriota bacterium]|nr:MAG: heparinase II/III family protein [Acidobacteriota bacterium]